MFSHLMYDITSSTFLRFATDVGVKIKAGMEAGSKKKDCIEVTVNNKSYSAARIIWELVTGEAVEKGMFVVPLDGNPHNLNFDNLTLMTHQQRRQFYSLVKGKGGHSLRMNKDGTARAYFIQRIDGETKVEALGLYDSREDALEVYRRRQVMEVLKGRVIMDIQ